MSNLARIREAFIGASGETFVLILEETATGLDVTTSAVASTGTLTLTVNGSPIVLQFSNAIWENFYTNFVWFSLPDTNANYEAVKDDTDSGVELINGTGYQDFLRAIPRSGAPYHGTGIQYGTSWTYGVRGTNMDAGMKVRYTFTSVPPGFYDIYANIINHPVVSTDLQYDLYDGAIHVNVGHVDGHAPTLDDTALGFRWTKVTSGTVDGGTLIVEVSDAEVAALALTTDAIRIVRRQGRVVPIGATVTLDITDANWVTAHTLTSPSIGVFTAGPDLTVGGISGHAVSVYDDSQLFALDITKTHTYTPGYNLSPGGYAAPGNWANRIKDCSSWHYYNPGTGTLTLDVDGQMTELSGGATAWTDIISANNNTLDQCGYLLAENGTWHVYYNHTGSDPLVNLVNAESDSCTIVRTPTTSGSSASTFPGTSTPCRHVSFAVTRAAIDYQDPVKRRYTPTLKLFVTSPDGTNSALADDAILHGPEIPTDWPYQIHPTMHRILKGKGYKSLRYLDCLQTNGVPTAQVSDLASARSVCTARTLKQYGLTIASIAPVDITPADTDGALTWFPFEAHISIVKITTVQPHGFKDLQQPIFFSTLTDPDPVTDAAIKLDDIGRRLPSTGNNTGGGGTYIPGFAQYMIVIDDHTFLCRLADDAATNTSPGGNTLPTTLSGTITSTTWAVGIQINVGFSPFDVGVMATELETDAWVNVADLMDDACVAAVADGIFSTLDSSLKVYVASANEIWNFGNYQTTRFSMKGFHAKKLWDAGDHVNGLSSNHFRYAHARRSWQVWEIFEARAVAAGRPTSDVIRVLETQEGAGYLTDYSLQQLALDGKTFDILAPSSYQNNKPVFRPYDGSFGDSRPVGAAFDSLSDEGIIDLLYVHIKNSGWREALLEHWHALITPRTGFPSGYDNVRFIAYEGGFSRLREFSNGSTISDALARSCSRLAWHPRMARVNQFRMQSLENLLEDVAGAPAGWAGENTFTLNSPGTPPFVIWYQHLSENSVIGRGDGELELDGITRLNDNRLDMLNYSKVVSPLGWSQEHYASGENPMPTFIVSPTSTPTPTPTPHAYLASSSLAVGSSATATASGFTGGTVAWTGNNTPVATINSSTGVYTGVSAGSATFTATGVADSGETATTGTLTVTTTPTPTPTAGLGLTTVPVGSTGTATASNFTGTTVTWASNAMSIATINASTGVYTGVAAGSATFTATGVSNPAQSATTGTLTVTAVTPTPTPTTPTATPSETRNDLHARRSVRRHRTRFLAMDSISIGAVRRQRRMLENLAAEVKVERPTTPTPRVSGDGKL